MADEKELEEFITQLHTVILTKATKGGSRIAEIKKDYKDMCGKDIDTRKFGFNSLENFLQSFKNKFYCRGDRWFGETTEAVENIVQSMATEKSKKGGRSFRKPAFERAPPPGFRSSSRPNFEPPRGYSRNDGNHSSKPFTPRNDQQFRHSASDGRLPNFGYGQQNRKPMNDERELSSNARGDASNPQIVNRFGFGNTSYNIASETASLKSTTSSSTDENQSRELYYDAPPGFDAPSVPQTRRPPSSAANSRASEGLPSSSRTLVPRTVEEPSYPPGLDIEIEGKRVPTPVRSNTVCSGNGGQPIQLNNLEIARKVFDLLRDFPQGLLLREISQRISLPQNGDEQLSNNAKIGVAVTTYKHTFSMNPMGPNGRVTITPGALRPGSEMRLPTDSERNRSTGTPYLFRQREDSDRARDRRESTRDDNIGGSGYNDRPRRDDPPTYRDDGSQHYTRGPYGSESEGRSSRFSAPAFNQEARRQSPSPIRRHPEDMYSEEERLGQGWGGQRWQHPWRNRADSREPSLDRRYESGGGWPSEQERYPQYGGDMVGNGYPRRRVPQEPKKYECKHIYLMDSSEVPYEESVRVTHFVALDEFYVRFESEEDRYKDMLAQLRDDYTGELESARPQLWMKGDGVAVWLDRQWQRGVVYTPMLNNTSSTIDVFLIDVGKTVAISREQVLPLHGYYHKPPFAVCCSIGSFDIFRGRRPDLLDECNNMADAFMSAKSGSLVAEITDKIWDDKEKLKVRLCYRQAKKDIFVPDYLVVDKIIDLR
ncbi:hypothetical protein V3C99_005660 [Haemonchus contortus]